MSQVYKIIFIFLFTPFLFLFFVANDVKIKDGKLKIGVKRQAAKMSVLSSGKINKDEYLTSEEILTAK